MDWLRRAGFDNCRPRSADYRGLAHDTMDFHAEALAAGCDAYITKPIDYGELEGLIESLLDQQT